jgi:hypothetical protein
VEWEDRILGQFAHNPVKLAELADLTGSANLFLRLEALSTELAGLTRNVLRTRAPDPADDHGAAVDQARGFSRRRLIWYVKDAWRSDRESRPKHAS